MYNVKDKVTYFKTIPGKQDYLQLDSEVLELQNKRPSMATKIKIRYKFKEAVCAVWVKIDLVQKKVNHEKSQSN